MRRNYSPVLLCLHFRHVIFHELIRVYSRDFVVPRDEAVNYFRCFCCLTYNLGGYNEFQYFSRKIYDSFSVHDFLLNRR